jgi:hypothetical protein
MYLIIFLPLFINQYLRCFKRDKDLPVKQLITTFNVFSVQVHDIAAVDLHSVQLTAVPLESDVVKLFIFHVIGALHLYNVPGLTARRIKDVHPAGRDGYLRRLPQTTAYAVLEISLSP